MESKVTSDSVTSSKRERLSVKETGGKCRRGPSFSPVSSYPVCPGEETVLLAKISPCLRVMQKDLESPAQSHLKFKPRAAGSGAHIVLQAGA
jgi:hypothetical protein